MKRVLVGLFLLCAAVMSLSACCGSRSLSTSSKSRFASMLEDETPSTSPMGEVAYDLRRLYVVSDGVSDEERSILQQKLALGPSSYPALTQEASDFLFVWKGDGSWVKGSKIISVRLNAIAVPVREAPADDWIYVDSSWYLPENYMPLEPIPSGATRALYVEQLPNGGRWELSVDARKIIQDVADEIEVRKIKLPNSSGEETR